MDDAWTSFYSAILNNYSPGDYVWVRQGHSETAAAVYPAADVGTLTQHIVISAWPRASQSINCNWTNGGTSVTNVDGSPMASSKHIGRYITGPNGEQYVITQINSTSSFTIDREYEGSTAINQDVTISADELWADDMGTTYSFDDSLWTIQESDWDSDTVDMPTIDFDDNAARYLYFNGDAFYEIHNMKFMDSSYSNGIVYCSANQGPIYFIGCWVKQSLQNDMLVRNNSSTIVLKRCIIEGSGSGASQYGIYNTGNIAMYDSAIYNCGDNGIVMINGNLYVENVNVGVETANGDNDLYLYYPNTRIWGRDLDLGGTNGYIVPPSFDNHNSIITNISIENYLKVLGDHISVIDIGSYQNITLDSSTTTPRKKVSDIAVKINCVYSAEKVAFDYIPGQHDYVLCHEFEADTSSKTYKYWIYNNTNTTLNPNTATENVWLEAEYVSDYDDTSEYVIDKAYSTETSIADAADVSDWDYLEVTVQPAVASKVRIKLYVNHYDNGTGTIFIDPAVVIS